MPDSSDIDNALRALLGADATLLAAMTNGVYQDEAPPKSTRFVIVSLVDETDVQKFGGRSHEDTFYLVKAVARSQYGGAPVGDVKAAAARIDALLDAQVLTVSGYSHMVMQREDRVRFTEVDEIDTDIRWHHRGGHYRVVQSL